MLWFQEFDSFSNFGCTLGKQTLGQGTDKKGSNRGLDLGSFTEFGVPSLPFDSLNFPYLIHGTALVSHWPYFAKTFQVREKIGQYARGGF